MAQAVDAPPKQSEHTISWLILCLGSDDRPTNRLQKKKFDQQQKNKDQDEVKEDDDDVMHQGLKQDFLRMKAFAQKIDGVEGHDHRKGDDSDAMMSRTIKVKSYVSGLSVLSDQLTGNDVGDRITKWLTEDADEYVFYYSGDGGEAPAGFVVNKDDDHSEGVYTYKELAETINRNKRLYDPNQNMDTPMVTLIVDTCYSGMMDDAFMPYQQTKYQPRRNPKDALFYVFYSSQKDERSVEDENGGIYTRVQFSDHLEAQCVQKWLSYFVNGDWDPKQWEMGKVLEDHDIA